MTQDAHHPEQRALKDVRALVEEIERDQARRKKWLVPIILAIVVPAVLWFGFVLRNEGTPALSSSEAARHACQMDAWASRSGDLARDLRQKYPDRSAREIQAMLERERPFVMAHAKIDCDARSK